MDLSTSIPSPTNAEKATDDVMAAAERLRLRILSAGAAAANAAISAGSDDDDQHQGHQRPFSSTRANVNGLRIAAAAASSSSQSSPVFSAREWPHSSQPTSSPSSTPSASLQALPTTSYDKGAATPPGRSHTQSATSSSPRDEPSLYAAVFGPSVARQLEAAASAATPKTPPQTPSTRHSFSFLTPSSASLKTPGSPTSRRFTPRLGLSAKLHQLSSMPQLGSPDRSRHGGPPAGVDPHNEPTQDVLDREEEMAFAHPHQSFVLYQPSPGRASPSYSGQKRKHSINDNEDDVLPPLRSGPLTPRRKRIPSQNNASGLLPNGHPATPLAQGLGLAGDGRRSRQSSANVSTPRRHPQASSAASRPSHGGREETDRVAGMLAALVDERESRTPDRPASSPFADPSSITPRRARPPAQSGRMVSEGDALAANVLLGFSASPARSDPTASTAASPVLPPKSPRLSQPLNTLTPTRQPRSRCTTADGAPRTPSPTPSAASAVPETPRTPNTNAAFAYSDFVNVSPSPRPRSRGTSGRFVDFAEGEGWSEGEEVVDGPGFANHARRRSSRGYPWSQQSHQRHVLTPGSHGAQVHASSAGSPTLGRRPSRFGLASDGTSVSPILRPVLGGTATPASLPSSSSSATSSTPTSSSGPRMASLPRNRERSMVTFDLTSSGQARSPTG